VAAIVLVTAALSLGQAFFAPLALALLLAFLLAPLSARLERLGLGRPLAVVAVCTTIGVLRAESAGWRRANGARRRRAGYRANLVEKITTLRGPLGSVGRAADAVSELEAELTSRRPANRASALRRR
jgi:hypothetical protein